MRLTSSMFYVGEQPPIVEAAVWEPIQKELRAKRPGATGKFHQKQNALLNGLLFCHLCQRPMTLTYGAAHGRRYRYYVCRSAENEGGTRFPARAVSAPVIEESVVAQLRLRLGRAAAYMIRQQRRGP